MAFLFWLLAALLALFLISLVGQAFAVGANWLLDRIWPVSTPARK